uniref:Uncharacterized protein n=1 Tax=Knipowitschia caucasica TaxID=637954 RepID=A0AAV2LBS8_KNICA
MKPSAQWPEPVSSSISEWASVTDRSGPGLTFGCAARGAWGAQVGGKWTHGRNKRQTNMKRAKGANGALTSTCASVGQPVQNGTYSGRRSEGKSVRLSPQTKTPRPFEDRSLTDTPGLRLGAGSSTSAFL